MPSKTVHLFYVGSGSAVMTRTRHHDGSWSAEQSLGGAADSDITAALIPGTHPRTLQLFYVGSGSAVMTRTRHHDGSWSAEQSLGGVASSDITAVVVPGTEVLQLFYVGADMGVHSRWRNPDGSWSGEQSLGGVVEFGDITAVVVPGTEVLQLFYVGRFGVSTRWRNPDGSWSAEQRLGGIVESTDPSIGYTGSNFITASVVPGTEVLQLFYRSGDDHVHSVWRNPDGSWHPPNLGGDSDQNLGGGFVGSILSGIAAIMVPGTEVLQLFYQGRDSAVHSRWRDPDGSWSPTNSDQNLGGKLPDALPDIAAVVVPGTEILQLFYVGTDNAVHSRRRNPDGSWSPAGPDQNLGGTATSEITAVAVHEP
jgi:hypothetical protein